MTRLFLTKNSPALALLFPLLLLPAIVFGQYVGSPVKKDNLVRVLASKQFQTRDVIQIINESGVDFKLISDIEDELVAAGAPFRD